MRFGALALVAAALVAADPYALERDRMVREQIEARGIRHPDVLRAMRTVQRHLFVPATLHSMAYDDHPVPIGYEATISQPYIVALMTELADPPRNGTVLEIGTGSGYQAAILAGLVRRVYSIEIVPQLANAARARLKELGYSNVTVRQGDGYKGWPEASPFDRIILTAAPPDVPQVLLEQLAAGGRLVAPVGATRLQELVVVEKDAGGKVRRRSIAPVAFVPMRPGK